MSKQKREELIERFNELAKEYDRTKSWAMKGHCQAEMTVICEILNAAQKEN